VKKFYSIRLKHYKEFIPKDVAFTMLIEESNQLRWLHGKKALEVKYIKSRCRLDFYAEEKHLTMAQMMHPDIFDGRGRMGFMELYISRLIKKKLQIAKGSS
jgi:hypothetical protein